MSSTTDCFRAQYVRVRFPYVLILTIGACLCFGLTLCAQMSESQTTPDVPQQWQATTDVKSDDLMPQRIPVRVIESHSQNSGRILDKRAVEIRGTDGHFEPYQDIEKETLTVDASTVRTTMRTFARDTNGERKLIQTTEEEKQSVPGGDLKVMRVTSNPDLNGKLQPVQREIVTTKKIGTNLEETNTSVMLPNINGGLAPAYKTYEIHRRAENGSVEAEKTTWLTELNGKWQVSEFRRNTTTPEGNDRRVEETVFRPDAEGKLAQVSRVVRKETESTSEESRNVVETYSIDVPGTTRDGSLHLVERTTSIGRPSSTGGRQSEQTVEQINAGNPDSGLRVTVLVSGRMVPGPSGEESAATIRARDSNGNFAIVSVDTTKSDRIPTIGIQLPEPQ